MSIIRSIVSTSLAIISPTKYIKTVAISSGSKYRYYSSLSESNFDKIAEEALETLSGQIDDVLDKVDMDSDVSLSVRIENCRDSTNNLFIIV